jgi:thiamine-monophosphate kinase
VLSLTTTVLGSTARPLPRAGARDGDIIFVTGRLGGPGAALAALLAGERPDAACRARFASPVARIAEARWCAEQGARAAIDISDGLVSDAGHLARASGVAGLGRLVAIHTSRARGSGGSPLTAGRPPGSLILGGRVRNRRGREGRC